MQDVENLHLEELEDALDRTNERIRRLHSALDELYDAHYHVDNAGDEHPQDPTHLVTLKQMLDASMDSVEDDIEAQKERRKKIHRRLHKET